MSVARNTTPTSADLPWPPLVAGTLIQRYKRFLADVRLPDGRLVTAHCPNSGRMTSCCQPGRPVFLSQHDRPERKLKFTWELIDMPTSIVGVNTLVPNRLVGAAAASQSLPALAGYESVRSEVKTGPGNRLDLMLEGAGRRACFVEVKNCTLVDAGVARFPDAVTTRGSKHLQELTRLAADGHRAVIFFLVQRMDAGVFEPADRIDPDYGRILRQAAGRGVEVAAWDVSIDLQSIRLRRSLPCRL
jgi:sugar fermentation stimulation protein A